MDEKDKKAFQATFLNYKYGEEDKTFSIENQKKNPCN